MTFSHPIYGDTNYIVQDNDSSTDVFMAHESNSDYQQYLVWLAAGNTPEPWNPEQENK